MDKTKQEPVEGEEQLDYIPQARISPFDAARPQRWNWALAKQPFDRTLQQQAQRPLTDDQMHNLRSFWLDGFSAATSEAFYLAYIPLFAIAYGATNGQVGWITAIGNLLGAIALFPGARLMETTGQKKWLVVWSGGGLARLALVLLAMIPLFALPPNIAIIAIASLNGIRAFAANLGNPAWTALVAEIVPEFMRGRYLSARDLTMGLATLIVSVLAGWIIAAGNGWGGNPYLGFQLVFFLAFVTGMASTYAFARIIEPRAKAATGVGKTGGQLRRVLRSGTGYSGFVISGFVWNFALQVAAPFFNVYLVTHLGADTTMVGIVTAISSLTGLFGLVAFGRLMDRKGAIWLQIVTGFPIALLPILWAFYTAPWQVGVNNMFGGFLWAGFNLANFNLLLQLTPEPGRARAVALYQTGVFASAVIGPLIGGYLADNVSFELVFWVSGIGRFVAMALFVWLTAIPLSRLAKTQFSAQAV